MSRGLVPSNQEIWKLIQGYFGGNIQIVPYIQEIFLLECHIAGTSYQDLEAVEPDLNIGDALLFRREPDNAHDPWRWPSTTGRSASWATCPAPKTRFRRG